MYSTLIGKVIAYILSNFIENKTLPILFLFFVFFSLFFTSKPNSGLPACVYHHLRLLIIHLIFTVRSCVWDITRDFVCFFLLSSIVPKRMANQINSDEITLQ